MGLIVCNDYEPRWSHNSFGPDARVVSEMFPPQPPFQPDMIGLEVHGDGWRVYHGGVLVGRGPMASIERRNMKFKPNLPDWF
jgi:hypothetical protein